MTELQWLIKLLTKHKLSPALKNLFIERIGEVESQLSSRGPARPIIPPIGIQAPSTMKNLEEAIYPTNTSIAPRTIIPTEVVTSKGNGTSTRGPRKF